MSYVVAFVKFTPNSKEFPVNCLRADLVRGDDVIVRRADGSLRYAIVTQLQYLNWHCMACIECKKAEASIDGEGAILLPKGAPLKFGMLDPESFSRALKSRGWLPVKKTQKMYIEILALANNNAVAFIYLRKNGIDLQILPKVSNEPIRAYSLSQRSLSEGKVVRHSLSQTTFNLYEGIIRFADSFARNDSDLDRYFVPQGSKDRRTEELRRKSEAEKRAKKNARSEMQDIYDACSDGSGGPAYLGDGMWITSDGDTHDWGR